MNDTIETTAVAVRDDDNPAHLMRRATDVAGVSRAIVKKTAVKIQNREYVRVEGWTAIAVAHGCVASAHSVERVETGFRAVGEVRRMSDGVVLATAEGFVGDDEKMWASRSEYAKRAMAQTRAISRVCRSAFAHVVVLIDANLSTTPAEEMTSDEPETVSNPPPAPKNAPKANPEPKQATLEAEVTGVTQESEDRKVLLAALGKLCPSGMMPELRDFLQEFTWTDGKVRRWLLPNEGVADLATEKLRTLVNNWKTFDQLLKDSINAKDQIAGAEIPVTEPEGERTEAPLSGKYQGAVQHVTTKTGKKKNGESWTLYGVKIDEEWFNTFDTTLGKTAEQLKGSMCSYDFEETDKGNTLLFIAGQ